MATVRVLLWLSVFISLAARALANLSINDHEHNPAKQIEIQRMHVDCKVASRFAHTVMTSRALNTANASQEAFFEVDLPKTAFITNFTIEVEDRVYVSEVKEKEQARELYESAVSSGQIAGLVKASGRHMEKFSVSVNIAARSTVTFTLTYEELLQRRLGSYEIMIGVRPKQLVQDFQIVVDIYEPNGIAFMEVNSTFVSNEQLLPLVEKTLMDKEAQVRFSPSRDQQKKCSDCGGTRLDGDLFIKYDVNHTNTFGELQIVNGYFVHFFAPDSLPQIPKNVTREALLTILSELHEEDFFGLVTFNDNVEEWRPSLSKASSENVTAAKEFVKSIEASSMTNINEAVLFAVEMLTPENNRSALDISMIILLTDGMPSFGVTSTSKIQENVRNAINGSMSLFCLGFGYDVDYTFLDTMAKQNGGLARRVYEASDAALQLQGFYAEVASPLLLEVHLRYPSNVSGLTQSHFRQFFKGSEIVVAGRLDEHESNTLEAEVSAQGLEERLALRGPGVAEDWGSVFPDVDYIFGDFIERLWAYLTIQQLLESRETCPLEEKENTTAEALDLSLRFNFVTPLTSMVVIKPEDGETLVADKLTEDERDVNRGSAPPSSLLLSPVRMAPRPTAQHSHPGKHSPMGLRPAIGQGLPFHGAPVNLVDGDPHFIIELPDQNDALCFNIDDKPGTIFNLVRDPLSGIVVNGQIIGEKKLISGSKPHTYFGRFGVVDEKLNIRLMVSTKEISVMEEGRRAKLSWSNNKRIKGRNVDLQVIKDRSLTVTVRNSVKFLIILHKVWEKHPYHQDYLGFYTLDSHRLSHSVHGLLGQFYQGVHFEVSDLFPGKDPDKQDAVMFVKGNNLTVTRGWQRDFRQDEKNGDNVTCWFVHNNGFGLIDGVSTDYITPDFSDISKRWIEVQSVKVECKVTSRFAHTVMTTKTLNKANISQEVFFEVEEIDGKTYTGVVKEKEKAKQQYQKAVASGQTAGLVKASGRKMEKFSVSVNVAANSSVIFVLTHEELLQRHFGKYELMIRVKPKELVQHFEIVADIYEPQGIAFVDAYGTFITNELLPLVEKTVTDKKAHVSFSPTLDQQRSCSECEGTLIDGDFFIKYDVHRAHDIGDIQVVNGYFVHYFAPANLPRVPKMVVFVIDNSLSMHGTPMAQTKEALVAILGELPEDDYFAIIVFSTLFVVWRPYLCQATEENVKEAQNYVKTIEVIGGTELHDAVIHGVEMLYAEQRNATTPKNMVPMIILLTDGEPNTNRKSLSEIQESIRNAIDGNITLFSLAFGSGADYGFLDTLSKQNNGLARRIYTDSDAPLQLKGFYEEVSSPLLSELNFHYPDNSVNSLTRSHFKHLFNGSELTVAGRLNDINEINFPIEVHGQGFEKAFEIKGHSNPKEMDTNLPDEQDKGTAEEKGNITAEALRLSLKYNFVTPLTSMVVTKPEDEAKNTTFIADKLTEVDGDPHFIIELPDQNDALCFNIDDKPGTIFNLVRDPLSGIVVNGQTIGEKKVDPGKKINTYFGRFGILHEKLGIRMMVSTKEISVFEDGKHVKLFWGDTATVKGSNMDLQVIKDRSLTVALRNSVKFLIILHKVWQKHPYHQDYLGFYTLDSHRLSHSVHGLLGQFYHGLHFEVSEVFPGEDPNKPDAFMGWQRDFRQDEKNGEQVPCWFIHNNGTGLLDGALPDYIVSGLFKTT
ncbi:hypothetical protein DNTS_026174 [Danionella cerebrum]|uniref:Inter-alpha-trypsin inhibitor heavy chain H3 n=1 Tax=Danionella cerebrum TaxID=2873325 RepID=A0A553RI13_9TELE|nr:hypothetical protein DNTS_026174 [Danionella translucida]